MNGRLVCEIPFGSDGSVTKVWLPASGVARLEQAIDGQHTGTVWLTCDEWGQIGAALGWAPAGNDRSMQ